MSDSNIYEAMSIEELREIIEKDTTNYEAQYVLAKMLIKLEIGDIQKNKREAFELLNMAIKNKEEYLPAWHLLGHCYEYGIGIEKNDDMAIKCYVIASKINDYDTENGYAPSQYKIARICEDGKYGLKRDVSRAFELYFLSAQNKYLRSKYRLALCYKNGIGISKDIIKSKYLLEELVKSGYKRAKKSLYIVNKKRQKEIKCFLKDLKKPKKEPVRLNEYSNKFKSRLTLQTLNNIRDDLISVTPQNCMEDYVCLNSPRKNILK